MSFSKFPWLKRTHGEDFTPAEFRILVTLFDYADGKTGRDAHPGLDRLSEDTGHSKTTVSETIGRLKKRGWIHETYKGNGRAKLSSAYLLVPDAPNPGYRCEPGERCSTCSNTSPRQEPLRPPKGSPHEEPLTQRFPAPGTHGSSPQEPIRSVTRSGHQIRIG